MSRDRVRRHALFLPASGSVRQPSWQPSVDIYQTADGWLVKLDLAGIQPPDIRVTAAGNRLTVAGTRRDCVREHGCRYYRMEISYSSFERTVELPVTLEPQRLKTDYRDGMLLIYIRGESNS